MFAEQNPKITRPEVKAILKRSAIWCWSNSGSRKFFNEIDSPLRKSLGL
jgi:hypothetical protein